MLSTPLPQIPHFPKANDALQSKSGRLHPRSLWKLPPIEPSDDTRAAAPKAQGSTLPGDQQEIGSWSGHELAFASTWQPREAAAHHQGDGG